MKRIQLLAIAFCSFVFITSCKKTSSPTDIPPSEAAWQKLYADRTNELTQRATFDASNAAYTFTSTNGTAVTINGGCLRKNGVAVTGQVTLELLELFNRKDMLLTNKPTMGKATALGDQEMLTSGGSFNIRVKQGDAELTTNCSVIITTPTANTGGVQPDMKAFNGSIVNNDLVWDVATTWEVYTVPGVNSAYKMNVPGFGWYNCDKFIADPRPKTTITAKVPNGYGKNCAVYLLAKEKPNSLASIYGKYPVGLACYLIFLTEKDGQYRWITQETTLTANHNITFDLAKATTGSKADWVGHVVLLK